jgi:hypothetical protein
LQLRIEETQAVEVVAEGSLIERGLLGVDVGTSAQHETGGGQNA